MPSSTRLLFLVCCWCLSVVPAAAQLGPAADSLRRVLATAQGEARVDVLGELCWTYRMIDADSARRYGHEALALAERLGYTRGLAAAHNNLGVAYEAQSAYDEALRHHRAALVYKTRLGDSLEVANTYNNIGIVLDEQGRYHEALTFYHRALDVYEGLDDRAHLAMVLVNIAIVHKRQKDYALVQAHYERALALYTALGDAFGQAACLANLGSVLLETAGYERSLAYSQRAAEAFERLDARQFIPVSVVNIGIAYLRLGRLPEAEAALRHGLRLSEAYQDRKQTAYTRQQLAALYLARRRPAEAAAEARQSLALAEAIQAREEVREANRLLAEAHAALGDFRRAYRYQQRAAAVKDSLYESEKARQIAELRTSYETEQKERQIASLEQEKRLQYVALERNRALVAGLGVALALLVVVAVGGRQRMKLARQHALARQALELKEAHLGAVIAAQEAERKRIARDLHDGVGQQLGGLRLAWRHLAATLAGRTPDLAPELDALACILDEAGADVRALSHQMMPRALQQLGLAAALADMLRKAFDHTGIACTFEPLGVDGRRYDETVEVGLYRIAQELTANVLRHAGARTVTVQLYPAQDQLVLRVEDDGCGLDPARPATGHGLANIESRLGLLHGHLHLDTPPGGGLAATIRVPAAPCGIPVPVETAA